MVDAVENMLKNVQGVKYIGRNARKNVIEEFGYTKDNALMQALVFDVKKPEVKSADEKSINYQFD